MNQPPLIILRGSDISYLGIVRSCFEASIPCIGVQFTWPEASTWFSQASRYQPPVIRIANPYTHPTEAAHQFRKKLEELFGKWKQKLFVLPSSDTNLMFVLDYYQYFEPYILLMGHSTFDEPRYDVIHKASCAQLLMNRVPDMVPTTYRCNQLEQIDFVVNKMTYPAVYKPAVKDYGQTFYANHGGNKAISCDDKDELRLLLTKEIEAGFDLLVQEKLFFDSVYDEIPYYLYVDGNGQITMAANGVKEIIEPFPFGTAIALRFAWYPELTELAYKVVDALSYRGILMIEFVKDRRDNRWKVIEVNPRHWLFNGYYHRLGLNYTKALYDDAYGIGNSTLVGPTLKYREESVHVDLAAMAGVFSIKYGNHYSLEHFIHELTKISGSISSPYWAPSDPEPGVVRLKELAHDFGWEPSILLQRINDVLEEDT